MLETAKRLQAFIDRGELPKPLLRIELENRIEVVCRSAREAIAFLGKEKLVLTPGVVWKIWVQPCPDVEPKPFWDSSIHGADRLPGKIELFTFNQPDTIMLQTAQQASMSEWARQNWEFFKHLPGTNYIFSTDSDRGFPCLEVVTSITESQLHKGSRAASINTPITEFAPAISSHRKAAIEEAISTGKNQSYTYHYKDLDLGLDFVFPSEVIVLSQHEVWVRVHNDDFTRQYWERRVAAGSAKPVNIN